MEVKSLRIAGFRGLKEAALDFDTHTVLVGPNCCGKSAVVDALALVLGRDRMVTPLTEHDFWGGDPQPADRFIIIATIGGFPKNDPCYNSDWFGDGLAVPKWLDPATGQLTPTATDESSVLCAQIGCAGRFDKESLSVELIRYFHDDDSVVDPFEADAVTTVPTRLLGAIGLFVVPVSRTWDRMMSFGSDLFRRLATEIPHSEIEAERDRLRRPSVPLEKSDALIGLASDINGEMKRLFSDGPELQLRVTGTDSESLLRAIVPHFQFADGPQLPAGRHGHGVLSVQTLILLMEYGRRRAAKGESFVMVIEEPEMHLPPGVQRRLIHRAQSVTAQTITTSHSPEVVALYPPTNVRILENHRGVLSSHPILPEPLAAQATNSARKLIRDNRVQLVGALMQERVLVPEGRTDFEWIRQIASAIELGEGWTSSGDDVSFGALVGLIPTHDSSVVETCQMLRGIRSGIAALVDGDEAGDDYVSRLQKSKLKPEMIIQWGPGWTIEDVIGWVIDGDATVLSAIGQECGVAFISSSDWVAKFKNDGLGLKTNYLLIESIAHVIAGFPKCMERARSLLDNMRLALTGYKSLAPMFKEDPRTTDSCQVYRWPT
ncbi:MAG: ATP-dependent nuclease [Bacillota bacterium]